MVVYLRFDLPAPPTHASVCFLNEPFCETSKNRNEKKEAKNIESVMENECLKKRCLSR